MRGDGTPYDIIYNLVGGNPVIYPISVVVLFLIYIAAFNGVYHLFKNKIAERKAKISNMATDEVKEEVTV